MARSTSPHGTLPVALTSFVGRRQEVADVRRYLSASRLVTLTGPGGVGKTRLAIEVAAEVRRTFPDGVWLIELGGVTSGSAVADALVAGLQVPEQTIKPPLDAVNEHLAARHTLIVLDNCEHLVEACAIAVDRLLRGCPEVRVLATSRQALGTVGEQVFPIAPLSVPDPTQPMSVERLCEFEAVNLVVDRAGAIQPGFTLTEQNCTAMARLCAELDGIPLAIELAVPRLRTLSVQQLVDRMTDRFGLLSAGSPAAAPRHRTLQAQVDWSYDLCDAREKRMWSRVGVFTGGLDLEAAEHICAGDGIDHRDVLGLLDSLVARSIVVTAPGAGQPRFRMLETLRQYGLARLAAADEYETVRDRHRDYFLGIVRDFVETWAGPHQEAKLAKLHADHSNLRTAFEQCLTEPDTDTALRLAAGLCWHWCANGYLSEGRRWLDQALMACTEPSPARAEALWVAGWVSLLQADQLAAKDRLAECHAVATELPDPVAAAHADSFSGTAMMLTSDPQNAVNRLRQAVDGLSALGASWSMYVAKWQLGTALEQSGHTKAARSTLNDVIDQCEAVGENLIRSYALCALARLERSAGRVDVARRHAEAGLYLQRGFRDSVGTVMMIEQLAVMVGSMGDHARTARLLGTIHMLREGMGTNLAIFDPQRAELLGTGAREARLHLGERLFQTAFDEGARVSVDEAIEFALEIRNPQQHAEQKEILTRREREVAELVGDGLSNRQIAERLVLSTRTVDTHIEHILAKLGFASRVQVAAWIATARTDLNA